MLHLSPFLVFWHKMNTLNTNMFWGSILPFLSEYIFLCYAKSCHEHSSCIYTTVKELIEPLVTHKGTYTHAHAKAKSPRNGLVYLCWGWKTLENHYFLFVFMYMKCMTKRNRLVRKRNTSWNIWFPQSFRFAQYFFIYDYTMRFLTIAQWNLVQYSDAIQIEPDFGFIFFYSR